MTCYLLQSMVFVAVLATMTWLSTLHSVNVPGQRESSPLPELGQQSRAERFKQLCC